MRNSMPMATAGRASACRSTLKPTIATSQEVAVVPMLLPMITPTAWNSVNRPALTKPTVAKITAEEDCTTAVMPMPERMPRGVVAVPRARISRRASPAATLSPSVIRRIPSRNRPMPPRKVRVRLMFIAASLGRAGCECEGRSLLPAPLGGERRAWAESTSC